MSDKTTDKDQPIEGFKNAATQQRWDLFHRAIAHAKRSNFNALHDEQGDIDASLQPVPLQSVAS
jgi:hypothetical protein